MSSQKTLAVIPARYASTRFPGKPLVDILGKTMIRRVVEQARAAKGVDRVVVATDDRRIYDHVETFGGEVVLTRADHLSGTDRCAEAAGYFPEFDFVINVQGDEPFIRPEQITLALDTLKNTPDAAVATLAKKVESAEALHQPDIVKVVFSARGKALYFSRHPIPYLRGAAPDRWHEIHDYFKHIGIYAFRRDTLSALAGLAPTPLERAESLEQLRWLENGYLIAVGRTEMETAGIDTPEDLERARILLKAAGG